MGHFVTTTDAKSAARQPEAWRSVSRQVGEMANKYAKRSDLMARVVTEAMADVPACFLKVSREIEVSIKKLGLSYVNPADVDLVTEEGRLRRAVLVGGTLHEAAHARHSMWDLPKRDEFEALGLTNRVYDVMQALEESRIEALLIAETPKDRDGEHMGQSEVRFYLRSIALDIIVKDFRVANTRYGASMGAALTLARVTSGVFDADHVADIRDAIEITLGTETLEAIEAIWTEYQKIDTANVDVWRGESDAASVRKMIDLAKRWLDVLAVDAEDETDDLAGDPMPGGEGEGEASGDGEPQESDGDGEAEGDDGDDHDDDTSGDLREGEASLADMIRDAASEIGSESDNEAIERRLEERQQRIMNENKVSRKRGKEAKKAADDLFPPGHGYGGDAVLTHLIQKRKPTDNERRAAVALAQRLEKIQYQDRIITKKHSVAPPGRLRPRGAMEKSRQRSKGLIETAQPWEARKRTHVDETKLRVALMTDLSGSMRRAGKPMGILGWMLSEAMRRVDGDVASVLYGARAYGVLKPGQHSEEVLEWAARDGFEAFKPAFKAVDGALNFLNDDSGARVLVIASDGSYGEPSHADYADQMMAVCRAKSIAVVWLDFTGGTYNHGYGDVVRVAGLEPVETAKVVGEAVVKALKRVDGKRG